MRDECEKCGPVLQVVIPRPAKPAGADAPAQVPAAGERKDGDAERRGVGLGRIFVLFQEPAATARAILALNGRSFNQNKVEATFYSETDFKAGKLDT